MLSHYALGLHRNANPALSWTFDIKLVINTWMRPNVLLISCYELGRQPLGLASPLAFLKRAGYSAESLDLSVELLDESAIARADFIAVSVPMHTALRLGLRVAERVQELNPGAHLCFFGLYATLNAELLLSAGADSVLSGECEDALVERIDTLGALGTTFGNKAPPPVIDRLDYPVPYREGLPPLEQYVHLELPDGSHRSVGTVESSRGCLHWCRHCPLPPVYGGRFFIVPKATVLEDIDQLVARGARHINFADPDFLNGPGHALEVARALHREHPDVTFDFTAKVEHLLKHRDRLPELAALGCVFIVSAVESLSHRVLAELDKGHTSRDAREALSAVREAGIAPRPTFVAFTPWTTREDYREVFRWLLEEDLVEHVDPIQLTLRLLIPPGSLLIENTSLQPFLGELDRAGLTYHWSHPDPGMDELQKDVEATVKSSVRNGHTNREIFQKLARRVGLRQEVALLASSKAPRLTEAWFC